MAPIARRWAVEVGCSGRRNVAGSPGPSNLQPGAATDPLLLLLVCSGSTWGPQVGPGLHGARLCTNIGPKCYPPVWTSRLCARILPARGSLRTGGSQGSPRRALCELRRPCAEEPTSRANNECVSERGEARSFPMPFDGGET
ncbi:hypothetical protein KIL84_017094 [Mauremys mutica]|uniref:Uncharacterized protein n=1 Tax=Mauremys mutica TaxID=74926 RepID=A0A9D3X666_9SAUR|nr:hypothetical protein KIL84_017094 [Mauremys mutica]